MAYSFLYVLMIGMSYQYYLSIYNTLLDLLSVMFIICAFITLGFCASAP